MENSSEQNDGQKLSEKEKKAQEYLQELVELNIKYSVGTELNLSPIVVSMLMLGAVKTFMDTLVTQATINKRRADNANSSPV